MTKYSYCITQSYNFFASSFNVILNLLIQLIPWTHKLREKDIYEWKKTLQVNNLQKKTRVTRCQCKKEK